jgi:2-amino-4-hydroxy-6-hydroxymethyldihydropteridine diphosphokinase
MAFILLGSNLGDRHAYIQRAVMALARSERTELVHLSQVYETPPWGKADQPAFLNAIAEIRTSLVPPDLLRRMQAIEKEIGRAPGGERWGPRTIDCDIVLYGNEIIESPALTVPHPHLRERAFALIPLLEVDPTLRDPRDNTPYANILAALPAEDREGCRIVGPVAYLTDMLTHEIPRHGLFLSPRAEETERIAEAFGARMEGGEIVAMVADLGAGKTCFARGIARGLGIADPVTSPSYVLVKSYEGRLALHHADFYRLAGPITIEDGADLPDVVNLGLEDYLGDPDAVVLIEWADRLPDWIEPPFTLVEIVTTSSGARLLHVTQMNS